MIDLRDIALRYPGAKEEVLSHFDLHAEAGERIALVGASGSGKTSLLALLGTLMSPSSGTYRFDGLSITDLRGSALDAFRARQIGFVFQQHALLPHLSALENVLLPFGPRDARDPAAQASARHMLERLGIGDLSARRPSELSGGQSQRVAIARALVRRPRLVLADEPTSALDDASAQAVVDLLTEACDGGQLLVMATHDARCLGADTRIVQLADFGKASPDARRRHERSG